MPSRRINGRTRQKPSRRKMPKVRGSISRAEALRLARFEKVVPICSVCGKIRVARKVGGNVIDTWIDIGVKDPGKPIPGLPKLTHGYCPKDSANAFRELRALAKKKQ